MSPADKNGVRFDGPYKVWGCPSCDVALTSMTYPDYEHRFCRDCSPSPEAPAFRHTLTRDERTLLDWLDVAAGDIKSGRIEAAIPALEAARDAAARIARRVA